MEKSIQCKHQRQVAISHKVDFKANKPKIQRCYVTTKGSIYPGRQSNPKYCTYQTKEPQNI